MRHGGEAQSADGRGARIRQRKRDYFHGDIREDGAERAQPICRDRQKVTQDTADFGARVLSDSATEVEGEVVLLNPK